MIFVLLILCILFFGFFTSSEIGFLSGNTIGLELKKKQGKYSAKLLTHYLENPSFYRNAALFGSLICSVLFMYVLLSSNILASIEQTATRLSVLFVIAVLVILIIAYLVPQYLLKKIGENYLQYAYWPITIFFGLVGSIGLAFEGFSTFIIKYLFNVRTDSNRKAFDKIDLHHFERQLKTGKEEESKDVNSELFANALELSNIRIRECLIPRNEIKGIEVGTSIDEVRKTFIESKHSKLLVYENDLDNIIGYLHHLDFYKEKVDLKELVHKIPAVPEAMYAVELLNSFTKNRKSIAWVVDEFGGTAGIVTMEDLLEEIFGEIEDEHDENEYIEKQISKNEFVLSGRLEVEYINEKFELDLPTNQAETLSGFIVEEHNAIPSQKDKIILGNFEFDILLVNKTRIETVKLKVLDNDD